MSNALDAAVIVGAGLVILVLVALLIAVALAPVYVAWLWYSGQWGFEPTVIVLLLYAAYVSLPGGGFNG